jgi:hypothetical protein
MNARSRPFAGLVMTCAALLPAAAGAAVLEAEPFNYPANPGSGLNGLNGGTGWNAPWSDTDTLPTLAATNTSLSYPPGGSLTPTGGRLETTAAASNNAATRALGTPIVLGRSQTFYSSALFRRSAVLGETAEVRFEDSDGAVGWYYGLDANGSFTAAVNPNNPAERITTISQAQANRTYLLVSRLRTNIDVLGTDEVALAVYFDVSNVNVQPDWFAITGISSIGADRVRLTFSNAAGQTNQFDEFRVGTTLADVTGVPEPSAASLAVLAAVLLAGRRRP